MINCHCPKIISEVKRTEPTWQLPNMKIYNHPNLKLLTSFVISEGMINVFPCVKLMLKYVFYFVDPVVMSCLVLMSCWMKTLNLGC